MGSLCWIQSDPSRWIVMGTALRLKPEWGGEPLLKVRYGTFDDEPADMIDLSMYMRLSVYEKVMSGEYVVSSESKFQRRLILLDAAGNEVEPLGSCCY